MRDEITLIAELAPTHRQTGIFFEWFQGRKNTPEAELVPSRVGSIGNT
jgi:hypothetical protein